MSLEGGDFQCYVHKFKTAKVEDWNQHCTKAGHVEEGSTRCRECDVEIKFKNLPFHPFDNLGHKNISLSCPKCQKKQSQVEVTLA